MAEKLNAGQLNMLRLIAKGQQCPDGWASVSRPVMALVKKLPTELVEWHEVGDEGRGRAMLKPAGQNLLDAMAWL